MRKVAKFQCAMDTACRGVILGSLIASAFDVVCSVHAYAQEAGDAPVPDAAATDAFVDPTELPDQEYLFLGAAYRHVFVPDFLLELGSQRAPAADNPAVGLEFTYRRDGFNIVTSLFWMGGFVEGAFLGGSDPDTATEWIDSSVSGVFAAVTFLWSTRLWEDYIVFEYGVGVGLGAVFGDLVRTEAEPDGNGGYRPCAGASRGNVAYCGPTASGGQTDPDGSPGEHYGVVARSWVDGGNLPNLVPWLALPHLAVRFKPVRSCMLRIEGGFGFGFFVGASAAYGF